MDEPQGNIECITACEALQWPDCGRPSHTFTHPSPSEAAKPPKPSPFLGLRPKLRSVLVNNTNSSTFYVVVVEGILKAHG